MLLVTASAVTAALLHMQPPADATASELTSRTAPATTRPLVNAYIIGDSVTGGTGEGTRINDRYGNITASKLNWSLTTDSVGGSGFQAKGPEYSEEDARFIQRLPAIFATDPEIAIVAGGRNDLYGTVGGFEASVTGFFTALRAGLPEAKIVTISTWRWNTAAEQYAIPLQADRASILLTIIESVGETFINPPTDLPQIDDTTAPTLVTEDGFLPTIANNKSIGEALARKLFDEGYVRGPEVWKQTGIGDDVRFVDETEAFFLGAHP